MPNEFDGQKTFLAEPELALEVLRRLGDGFWIWHVEENWIERDYKAKQIVGDFAGNSHCNFEGFLQFLDPHDADRVKTAIEVTLATGATFDCRYSIRRDDGSTLWVHDLAEVIRRTPSGRPLKVAGRMRDVTEAQRAELARRQSEKLFRDLADNIPGAIFQYMLMPNGKHKIEYMSPGCIDLWEIDQSAIENDPSALWAMVHSEDLPAMQRSVMELAETLLAWSHIWRVTTPSGRKKWLHGRGRPERLPEGGVRWNSLILDVTDQKEAEDTVQKALREANRANHAKTLFLAKMSHELRTPLNAIIGFSDIMNRQLFGVHGSPKYLEYSKVVMDSALHLNNMIKDILDITVVENDDLVLSEEIFDINHAVEFCICLLEGRAFKSGLTMKAEAPSSPINIIGDSTRLKQAMLNIIENAIKFTPAGGSVRVDVIMDESGLKLSVVDSGIGISENDLPVVTEAFWQANRNPRISADGVGIGLYVANQIIKRHDGDISIESRIGQGTRVCVNLPAERIIKY